MNCGVISLSVSTCVLWPRVPVPMMPQRSRGSLAELAAARSSAWRDVDGGSADLAAILYTSGTTGRPTAFAVGRTDWPRIAESHARVMWGMGIRPGDMVFEANGVKCYVDPMSSMYLLGVEVDYVEGQFGQSGFSFKNKRHTAAEFRRWMAELG